MQVPLAQITWYHHISLLTKVKDKSQRNTLCLVSVSVLTQKSATYFRKLLILIGLNRFAERARFELAEELPLRQFSKLVVSATHPSLRLGST